MTPDTTTPIPPVLYVPCEPGSTADDARLTVRATRDGRRALLAYTALDRLGLAGVASGIHPLFPTEKIAGPVVTVRLVPADGRPSRHRSPARSPRPSTRSAIGRP